jgi:hypothetical protein
MSLPGANGVSDEAISRLKDGAASRSIFRLIGDCFGLSMLCISTLATPPTPHLQWVQVKQAVQ